MKSVINLRFDVRLQVFINHKEYRITSALEDRILSLIIGDFNNMALEDGKIPETHKAVVGAKYEASEIHSTEFLKSTGIKTADMERLEERALEPLKKVQGEKV